MAVAITLHILCAVIWVGGALLAGVTAVAVFIAAVEIALARQPEPVDGVKLSLSAQLRGLEPLALFDIRRRYVGERHHGEASRERDRSIAARTPCAYTPEPTNNSSG